MTKFTFIIYNWFSVIIWFLFILLISSLPGLDIDGTSEAWTIRSLGYILMYAILFLLIFRAGLSTAKAKVDRLMHYKSKQEHAEDREFAFLTEFLIFISSVLLTLLFIIVDEYFQSFVPGRVAHVADVASNIIGIAVATVLVFKYPIIAEFESILFLPQRPKQKR